MEENGKVKFSLYQCCNGYPSVVYELCDIYPLFKAHRIRILTKFDAENEQTIWCFDGHPSVVLSCVIFIHYSRLIVLEYLQDLMRRMSKLSEAATDGCPSKLQINFYFLWMGMEKAVQASSSPLWSDIVIFLLKNCCHCSIISSFYFAISPAFLYIVLYFNNDWIYRYELTAWKEIKQYVLYRMDTEEII